jgi:aryl-alcohol dehydrogenase-like predicted oxidoreductase
VVAVKIQEITGRSGLSEEITGRWLRKYADRDQVVIATKVWPCLSRKNIQQACEASLRRPGVEVIDLYQLHRPDPDTPIEETLATLDLLVRQGKVRYVGASSIYAWEFMRSLGVAAPHGWERFISVQNQHNLLYREEEREMVPLCVSEGIGMMPWSPLARGILARALRTGATRTTVGNARLDRRHKPGRVSSMHRSHRDSAAEAQSQNAGDLVEAALLILLEETRLDQITISDLLQEGRCSATDLLPVLQHKARGDQGHYRQGLQAFCPIAA